MLRIVLAMLVVAMPAFGQTADVAPRDAELSVTVEHADETVYQSEMILLTIRGVYRRHVTREVLIQPDLEGFSWMQLGQDYWYGTTENGRPVKNLTRRMALFPTRPGEIEIGAFTHRLTFVDEDLKWFDHDIVSAPITVEVDPAPEPPETWLPVRRMEISDSWSNAPDQLKPGEGVLRIIRVEALGIPPDMLPPMPELTSPSAQIFPHPEKRLTDLSPDGPIAVAFWRWTIQPANPPSAIVEPLRMHYFDTGSREFRDVEISAQRIAYGDVAGPASAEGGGGAAPDEAPILPAAATAGVFVLSLGGGLAAIHRRRRPQQAAALLRRWTLDAETRALRRAAAAGDAAAFRRAFGAAMRARGGDPRMAASLARLDAAVFARDTSGPDLDTLLPMALDDLRRAERDGP